MSGTGTITRLSDSYGHISETWEDADKRTLILAIAYQTIRRHYKPHGAPEEYEGQIGYKVFCDYSDDIKNTTQWKLLTTTRKWLEKAGWNVGKEFGHWEDFIKFVFDSFYPRVPFPSQICNPVLLKRYQQEGRKREEIKREPTPVRTKEALLAIYSRILGNNRG